MLNTEKYDIGTFMKRKFLSLIVPAYIFMLLFIPVDLLSGSDMMAIAKGMLFLGGRVTRNDPCWFYITLFQAMCILRLLNVSRRISAVRLTMMFSSFVIGTILSIYGIIWFGVDKLFLSMGFILLGTVMQNIDFNWIKKISLFTRIVLIALICLIWGVIAIINGKVSMYGSSVGNPVLFIMSAILGSFITLSFCKYVIEGLDRKGWLIRVGRNSTIIVCSHYVIVKAFGMMLNKFEINGAWLRVVLLIITVLSAIAVYVPVCEWIAEHLPWLAGKIRKKEEQENDGRIIC